MSSTHKTLFIKKSKLPGAGLGLFTRIQFNKGDRIVEYKGRREAWKKVKAQDGYNGYLLRLNQRTAINALPYKKALGRFANDAAGAGRKNGLRNNSEYLIYGNKCYIEATRTINKGEEILVGYGKAFWNLQRRIRIATEAR
ncbi:MAG TPA: hypothetical protein PLR06_08220 [Cyclobacteriaceae bacterium]|nr:hypothetical protein [Cyclobacteriaceae bacterium]